MAHYGVLLARLEWPSCLVKERAATTISYLLRQPQTRAQMLEELKNWIASQELESCVVAGLTPLMQLSPSAQTREMVGSCAGHITAHSVLSSVVLEELTGETQDPTAWLNVHSGEPPPGFQPHKSFVEYHRSHVPPIYSTRAEIIGDSNAFVRQWAFEVESCLARIGKSHDRPPHFFMGVREDAEHIWYDSLQSEVYRSAFLRALSRAVADGIMSASGARFHALLSLPVDATLWQVDSAAKPTWWPECELREGGIDTAATEILTHVETMFAEKPWNSDHLLCQASGVVASDDRKSFYDLTIHSFLQAATGPQQPELDQLFARVAYRPTAMPSRLEIGLNGPFVIGGEETGIGELSDWIVVPVTVGVHCLTSPRWQVQRFERGVWIPSPALCPDNCQVQPFDAELRVLSAGHPVGRWFTWNDALRESYPRGLPSRAGVCLLLDRETVEDAATREHKHFGWIVKLTLFHRGSEYGTFEQVSQYKVLGASGIITA